MLVPEITIYDALKGMLGEDKARQVVQGIKTQVTDEIEVHKSTLATKEDLAKLEGKLSTAIEASKAEMIKWMFIFWLGSVGTLAGLMFALFHAYMK
jgi:hypothetical protein